LALQITKTNNKQIDMSNLDRYNNVFVSTFNVDALSLNDDFSTENVDNWDSVTQLMLVTAVEDEFDVMLDTDDILEFKSYGKGKEILSKYDVVV
jgi:acyl carrier protein